MTRDAPTAGNLIWDQHGALPLSATAQVQPLLEFLAAGVSCVSVNVGYAPQDTAGTLAILESFRRQLGADDRFLLATSPADVQAAHSAGRLAVVFDLEDANPLGGNLDLVEQYHHLGVRTLAPTYNNANIAGSGCLDTADGGLTRFGRALVAEMNRVGMVVDGSHCGIRTSLDLCATSSRPVIFSHVCMRTVWDHPRNITDEQARACAATGGVIGITGVGIFLGPNDISLETVLRHIDHAVDLVGPDHVGLATDYPVDHADFNRELAENPELFPDSYRRWGPIRFLPPTALIPLADALTAKGYPPDDVARIVGGNFLRVATEVWDRPPY